MKLSQSLSALCALSLAKFAYAANTFAGSNLYYAAGLSSQESATLFTGLQSAGMKVLRVWVDGESTATSKGTTIVDYPSLEPDEIGVYDDTVLNLLDNIMVEAHSYGIKLIISMHSWNTLSAGDVYSDVYGTGYFYEWTNATTQFDERLVHIVNHNHTTLGKPWKELSEYIIGFEAQNEAMIGNGQSYIEEWQGWQCDRAYTIRTALGKNSSILVFTGGESWMSESVQPDFLTCPYIDVISIHSYGTGDFDTSSIQTYVQQAQDANKLLIYEEWGACYYNTGNNDCPSGHPLPTTTRNNNIKTWTSQITAAGVPWLYWQVLPNSDPHDPWDYEIGINDASWSTLQAAALDALNQTAAFDFSAYLL